MKKDKNKIKKFAACSENSGVKNFAMPALQQSFGFCFQFFVWIFFFFPIYSQPSYQQDFCKFYKTLNIQNIYVHQISVNGRSQKSCLIVHAKEKDYNIGSRTKMTITFFLLVMPGWFARHDYWILRGEKCMLPHLFMF